MHELELPLISLFTSFLHLLHTNTMHLHAHIHTHALYTHTHAHSHTHTQHNLVSLLVSSINYLEHAERYEMMAEVFKLLQPFYEKQRDFKVGGILFLPGGDSFHFSVQ